MGPCHKVKSFSLSDWGMKIEKESLLHFKKMYKDKYYKKENDKEAEIPEKRRKLDNNLLDLKSVFSNRNKTSNWENEINEYLEAPCAHEDTNILHWWRDHKNVYPNLSKMAKDIFSIMSTSVPVERQFSNASLVDVPRRRSLKEDIFKNLVNINSWVKSELYQEICFQ